MWPLRAKEGAVRCGNGYWMHLTCGGVTVSKAKQVFRNNRVFQCSYRKARTAKWLHVARARQQHRRQKEFQDVREEPGA